MHKIKQVPEDFIVNEVSDVKTSDKGGYSYFILKKRDYATPVAVERIARFMNAPIKSIGYAGAKDRRAVTTQIISIEGRPERLKGFKDNDIELTYKGRGETPIYLGRLEGNKFEITVRNITKKPKKISKFINYFDEQRFSMNNVEIGRALVKKDFRKAVEVIMTNNGHYERLVKEYYEKTNDAIGSLRKIQQHVLMFFIHAYQSELWNKTVEKLKIKKPNFGKAKMGPSRKTEIGNIDVPIIGFGTEPKDKQIQKAIEKIMLEESITYRDFIIKSFPELTSEGNSRKMYAELKNLKIGKLEKDELNKGMKKCKVSFMLGKGSYATMAIKNMFK